jgi:hypothetical protein
LYSMQAHDTPKLRDTPDGDALLGGLDCWRECWRGWRPGSL